MSVSKKLQVVYCVQHDFNFTPLQSNLYFKNRIYTSFCGGTNIVEEEKQRSKRTKTKKQSRSCLNCPIYNKDKNPATDTFILPSEQNQYIQNRKQFLKQHEYKIANCQGNSNEIQRMFVAKPKSRYMYCNVCRKNYQDYIIHTKSKEHKYYISRSASSRYILQLQKKYHDKREGRIRTKKRTTHQSGEITVIEDSDDVNIECSMPRKRVKLDNINIQQNNQQNLTFPGCWNPPNIYNPMIPPMNPYFLRQNYNNQVANLQLLFLNPWCAFPPYQKQQQHLPQQQFLQLQGNQSILNRYLINNLGQLPQQLLAQNIIGPNMNINMNLFLGNNIFNSNNYNQNLQIPYENNQTINHKEILQVMGNR